jgi:hypothetical protein
MRNKTMDMTLTTDPETPAGKIRTACGRLLPDTGHGQLLAILDEAYELHNAHLLVTVGDDSHRKAIGRDLATGDVPLAPGLTAREGGVEVLSRSSEDGLATALVRIDGQIATLRWEDPYSLPQMRYEK